MQEIDNDPAGGGSGQNQQGSGTPTTTVKKSYTSKFGVVIAVVIAILAITYFFN